MAKKKRSRGKPRNARAAVARQVDKILRDFTLEGSTDEAVGEVTGQITALGAVAVRHLARTALRPDRDRREKVAAILATLEGDAADWAREEVARLAQRPSPNPTERLWVSVMLSGLSKGEEDREAAAADQEDGALDAALADESQLLVWRDELASLPRPQQEALLAPMLHSGEAKFLPLLSAILSLRERHLEMAIAGALRRFPTPETLPLLRELLKRPDPEVRRLARQSLLALARQGVEVGDVFVASEAGEPPTDAFLSSSDRDGATLAILVGGKPPQGFRYVVVLLDPIEAGIKGAWGESGLSEEELDERLDEVLDQMGPSLRRLPPEAVQSIIEQAEEFASAHGRELPADYQVWRRAIGRPAERWPSPIVFGPKCVECGRKITRGDLTHGGMVSGPIALCALCAAQPRACSKCHQPLVLQGADFLVRAADDGSLEFMCERCARGLGLDRR